MFLFYKNYLKKKFYIELIRMRDIKYILLKVMGGFLDFVMLCNMIV